MLLVHDQRISSTLLSCTEVKGSPDECIATGHGFERKAGAGEEGRTDWLRHPIMLYVALPRRLSSRCMCIHTSHVLFSSRDQCQCNCSRNKYWCEMRQAFELVRLVRMKEKWGINLHSDATSPFRVPSTFNPRRVLKRRNYRYVDKSSTIL